MHSFNSNNWLKKMSSHEFDRLHFLSDTTGTNFLSSDELVTLEVTATPAPTNMSFNDSFQAGAFDGKGKLELQLQ